MSDITNRPYYWRDQAKARRYDYFSRKCAHARGETPPLQWADDPQIETEHRSVRQMMRALFTRMR